MERARREPDAAERCRRLALTQDVSIWTMPALRRRAEALVDQHVAALIDEQDLRPSSPRRLSQERRPLPLDASRGAAPRASRPAPRRAGSRPDRSSSRAGRCRSARSPQPWRSPRRSRARARAARAAVVPRGQRMRRRRRATAGRDASALRAAHGPPRAPGGERPSWARFTWDRSPGARRRSGRATGRRTTRPAGRCPRSGSRAGR